MPPTDEAAIERERGCAVVIYLRVGHKTLSFRGTSDSDGELGRKVAVLMDCCLSHNRIRQSLHEDTCLRLELNYYGRTKGRPWRISFCGHQKVPAVKGWIGIVSLLRETGDTLGAKMSYSPSLPRSLAPSLPRSLSALRVVLTRLSH